MCNKLFSMLLICGLVGCSSGTSTQENHEVNSEELMMYSNNYAALATLYHAQLSKEEAPDTRKKLVQVYLDMLDPESAQFHLQPLMTPNQSDPEVWYLSGYAHYALGDKHQARDALMTSLSFAPSLAKF